MNRKTIIISALFTVGLFSFFVAIYTDNNLSLQQAVLALGTEGLKTAVLFVLVDYLIGDHERRKEEQMEARHYLNLAAGDVRSSVDQNLDKLQANGKISIDLTSNHAFVGQNFNDRKFVDSVWDSADFSRANFAECEFDNIQIRSLSFRDAIFQRVKFKNVHMMDTDLNRCLFVDCEFQMSNMGKSRCFETRFAGCHFFAMNVEHFPRAGAEYSRCVGVPKND